MEVYNQKVTIWVICENITAIEKFFKLVYTILANQIVNKGDFMETNLVVEGFKFMGLGMGTVFLFLVVMIICMNIMAYVTHKFFPEVKPREETPIKKNNNVIAAITAALIYHRQG